MAFQWFNSMLKKKVQNFLPNYAERDVANNFYYYIDTNVDLERCVDTFDAANAYTLAKALSEIFIPIDMIAERVSGLPYDLVRDSDGAKVEPQGNVKRLLERPNLLNSFREFVYNMVFYEFSDGNNYVYTKTPDSFSAYAANPDTIASLWNLRPDRVTARLKRTRTELYDAKDLNDILEAYQLTGGLRTLALDPANIIHESLLPVDIDNGVIKAPSVLQAVCRNINVLLAVYSARFNIFVNNGSAGIISREAAKDDPAQQLTGNAVTREKILADLKERTGLTGNRHIKMVSPIPLKYINTIATLKDLEPFKETEADQLQIAGVMGVPKDLLPAFRSATYNNLQTSERNLYQNVIVTVAEGKAETLTKALRLDTIGLHLQPDFSDVEVLQEDQKLAAEKDGTILDNIAKIKSLGNVDGVDMQAITNIINNIVESYLDDTK